MKAYGSSPQVKFIHSIKNKKEMKPIHVISAIIGGAIAGATVGLLLAPEKGEDVRKKIMRILKEKGICMKKSKMEELVDEIEEQIEEKL